jgi:O-antigen/teichoic acid export membrane protein
VVVATPDGAQARVSDPRTGLARGTLLVMSAEALAFPAGLLVTVLLTRHFAAADYGALALAFAAVAWLEWTVVTLFSRAAYKLIAEADDWRAVAPAVVRIFLLASLPVAAIVFAGAGFVAAMLDSPQLRPLLHVLALDIPLFVTAQAWRTVLVGRGLHSARAAVAALRWTARALLIAVGVLFGASLVAIAAFSVAATALELLLVRRRAMAGERGSTPVAPVGAAGMLRLLAYAAPLAVSAICMRLFDRMDIFALRLLGGSLESVAAYGVAQNMALAPALFGGAFTPALIAALAFHLSRGDVGGARALGSEALRAGFLVLPLALLAAGAAPALIDLLFGSQYAAAAPIFALLVVGAVGTLLIGLAGGVLVAAGRLGWTVLLTAPLLLLAVAGHLFAIPRAGAAGAAAVTAGTALLGAAAACTAVRYLAGMRLPASTLARGLVLGTAAGALARALPLRGPALLAALALLALLLACALALAGELRPQERRHVVDWLRARGALPFR